MNINKSTEFGNIVLLLMKSMCCHFVPVTDDNNVEFIVIVP